MAVWLSDLRRVQVRELGIFLIKEPPGLKAALRIELQNLPEQKGSVLGCFMVFTDI